MDPFHRAANEAAAIAQINAGNVPGGEARVRRMLVEDPEDCRALALLAHCQLVQKMKKDALQTARSAAQIDPDDYLVKRVLVDALLANGKNREADELAFDLASDDPEDSRILFDLAVARFNTKDRIGARELFDLAEQHAGDDVPSLLMLASLRLDQWNYLRAHELAARAVSMDPNQGEAFRILGECALAARQPVEAYELALEALRLQPGDGSILRLLTRARARRNLLLRPFLTGVDWIVEMDRRGLVILPILMIVLGAAAALAIAFDLSRIYTGMAPAIIFSVGFGGVFVYALVSYLTAVTARIQIRRDLRRIKLPRF